MNLWGLARGVVCGVGDVLCVSYDDPWCVGGVCVLQPVAWCVVRGSSCVLAVAVSSTSTDVTDMTTVGTSAMREGGFLRSSSHNKGLVVYWTVQFAVHIYDQILNV